VLDAPIVMQVATAMGVQFVMSLRDRFSPREIKHVRTVLRSLYFQTAKRCCMPRDKVAQRRRLSVAAAESSREWIEQELAGCTFKDERLASRFRTFLGQLAGAPGESIPLACQDSASTKAAYRSTQDLLREAINDLFTKYGRPPIA
jgi:hypothetical protein